MKPLFSEKVMSTENIMLVENNKICGDDGEVSEILNNFFSNAVKSLNIQVNSDHLNEHVSELDPVRNAIKKYEHHPSIVKIKEIFGNKDIFSFEPASYNDILKEITLLNVSKACPKTTIPPKIIKDNCDLFSLKLYADFRFSIENARFPNNFKQADISPVHKK